MTTVHAMTATQLTVDGPSRGGKDSLWTYENKLFHGASWSLKIWKANLASKVNSEKKLKKMRTQQLTHSRNQIILHPCLIWLSIDFTLILFDVFCFSQTNRESTVFLGTPMIAASPRSWQLCFLKLSLCFFLHAYVWTKTKIVFANRRLKSWWEPLDSLYAIMLLSRLPSCHVKDWRGGRCASENIIPSSTGAAKAQIVSWRLIDFWLRWLGTGCGQGHPKHERPRPQFGISLIPLPKLNQRSWSKLSAAQMH